MACSDFDISVNVPYNFVMVADKVAARKTAEHANSLGPKPSPNGDDDFGKVCNSRCQGWGP
jgi:hypothetical protein